MNVSTVVMKEDIFLERGKPHLFENVQYHGCYEKIHAEIFPISPSMLVPFSQIRNHISTLNLTCDAIHRNVAFEVGQLYFYFTIILVLNASIISSKKNTMNFNSSIHILGCLITGL